MLHTQVTYTSKLPTLIHKFMVHRQDNNLSVRTNIQTPLAVIIAGHDDLRTLQPNIEYSADLAYLTMLNSGIPKSRICYLALKKNRDVDKNGLADDIYGLATLENVRDTIENWPITQNIGPGVPFFRYLVDHGT